MVSWNIPGANRPGSVGRSLTEVAVKIADDKMEWLPQGIVYAGIPVGAVFMIVNMWRAHRGSGERRPLGLSSLGDQM